MKMEFYYPSPDETVWEAATAEQAGFDPAKIEAAARFASEQETTWPRDLRAHLEAGCFEPPPWNEIIGPVEPRGGPNGLILHRGRILAQWGDTRRADMVFSVAKSCLGLLTGLALADGLIRDLDEPVGATVTDGGFDGIHNGAITWRHLLQQTSEWEGTLWGKSDIIDRNRKLGGDKPDAQKGQARPLQAPGSFWEYNDVRVNRLSLALLRRFGRSLPEIFRERIMAPIGASDSWRWAGYDNSFVEIGGQEVQSVSGGGHWGGGLFIHAEDLARLGLLMLARGAWGARQVLARDWIDASVEPAALNASYGLLWWLNTGRRDYPSASAASYFAKGAGGNYIWVDPESELVAVMRWLDAAQLDRFIGMVMAARR
ncbi:MAG TPA: serine hydrolase [Aliidongia sp.]|nr:serine hydrolase [Aliidongia sp.]